MNKTIYQSGRNGSGIRNESTHKANHTNDESDLAWNYALVDVDELGSFITTIIKETYHTLGAGLPVCVYQLKLFNDLTKKGLKLKSGKSILSHRAEMKVELDNVKNNITVNDVLVIEYISSQAMSDGYEKIIKSALHENNYAMGLLVEVAVKKDAIEITKIDQNYIAH